VERESELVAEKKHTQKKFHHIEEEEKWVLAK
jgi:hypothetical protein